MVAQVERPSRGPTRRRCRARPARPSRRGGSGSRAGSASSCWSRTRRRRHVTRDRQGPRRHPGRGPCRGRRRRRGRRAGGGPSADRSRAPADAYDGVDGPARPRPARRDPPPADRRLEPAPCPVAGAGRRRRRPRSSAGCVAPSRPPVAIELVFDGPPERGLRNERIASGLTVRYSGPRTGDAVIIGLIDDVRLLDGADGTATLLVVTDDRDLRHGSRLRGARTAGSAWLLGRLDARRLSSPSVGNPRPARRRPPGQRRQPDRRGSGRDGPARLEAGPGRDDQAGQPASGHPRAEVRPLTSGGTNLTSGGTDRMPP